MKTQFMENNHRGIGLNVGATRRVAPTKRRVAPTIRRVAPTELTQTAPTRKPKPLGRIIGAYKTVSTKQINQLRNTPGAKFWQRNYYEHIIRNERELWAIRNYIRNNPLKWELDHENPIYGK